MVQEPTKRTPLHEKHQALAARLVPFAGFEMPIQYAGGISAEHRAVRERAGLFDVSHMGELRLMGASALGLVDQLVTNDIAHAADGQAVYTCCCNEQGTILDDLIVYRNSASDVLIVCNASNRDKIASHFAGRARGVCDFRDESDDTALLALQGPKTFDVLAAADGQSELAALKPFRFKSGSVSGIACTVARTGYTGEDGVELFCAATVAGRLWDALMRAGTAFGLEAVGLGARDTLRLEARLSLYGNDIDETTNPLEAGLGWVVKFEKPDFVGKSALVALKARGLDRTLVGFEMIGRGIARHGYPLLDEAGSVVGVCTSGGPSPTLEKSIGLGYLPLGSSALGTRFWVDCRGKRIEAMVVKTPFYKRSKAKA
ncbi:MAG TPA: glycine cleavage system aminomethyltransferase GcvT [Polyangiaceae bacterium]|jgi:aminomethyltransferase